MAKMAKVLGAALTTWAMVSLGGSARAATVASDDEVPEAVHLRRVPPPPAVQPPPWSVRLSLAYVGSHDGGLVGRVERGLTVGRLVTSRLGLEAMASLATNPRDEFAWSAMAGLRWEPLRSHNGQHALTLGGGPMMLFNNGPHGNTPMLHGEVSYLYRNPLGLIASVAIGRNLALEDSSFVKNASCEFWCVEEIHRGDQTNDVRLALGWAF